jgi:OTU domain-containing protein 5
MVNKYQSSFREFYPNEQVDCLDENGVWMNAEVLEAKPEQIKVHFSGFGRKFDAWVPNSPDRVVKQWRFGSPFFLNQRVDVRDTFGKWMEARVIDLNESQIRIHYRGFKERWDEWINFVSDRIAEIGSKSTAFGVGKSDPSRAARFNSKEVQEFTTTMKQSDEKETYFKQSLAEAGLEVFPIEGDGNCMFRSVSHQLYGNSQYHSVIRARTIEYMSYERVYFAQFIEGGLDRFDEYLEYKAKNGAWGDDTEIQAMSEIYDRPFYIYAYSATPMRTFHESEGTLPPIRVSYHGQCHYNSIVRTEGHQYLLPTQPGEIEEDFIRNYQARHSAGVPSSHIESMRQAFDHRGQVDLDEAIRLSLEEMSTGVDVQEAIQKSLRDQDEDLMLTQALDASRQEWSEPHEEIDPELQAVLAMSVEQTELSPAVREALSAGFSLEQAQQAVGLMGENPELVMDFLCSNLV